ncbi:hypothetical protein OsccyDRAFT_2790 [Leptolyngbyaceae cyanobacterium JSC-12]|nr:hypothetical protein OsccyDRAFT_2790 [Leptolyngbyaceae cyanobacterium JSC-12]
MAKELILAIFSLLFGACLCFWGYRLFLVMLPIWSFFAGFWLGAKGVNILFGGGFLATATGLTTGLVIGLILAIFSWQFYNLGLAILAAIIGAWLGSNTMIALGFANTHWLTALVALGGALALGILTYVRHWQQFLVMIVSAIAGANAIVLAFLLLNGRVSIEGLRGAGSAIRSVFSDSLIWLVIWLGLAIAGFIVQFRAYRRFTFFKEVFVQYWS